jgi:hypothetical protein
VIEMRLSSPQRFDLRVHNANGVRSVRLAPVAGAWVRAASPLAFLTEPPRQGMDLASVHNQFRPMIFINLSGIPGRLDDVRQIGFSMGSPVGTPSLEIRSVTLAHEDPSDALLDGKPVVDEFGPWICDTWPGKVANLDQLQAAWSAEEKTLTAGAFDFCKYGGFQSAKAKATGFFRVEKIDARWWFVDPDGHLFWSTGSDSIGTSASTPTPGREQLFTAIPTATSGGRGGASFYAWNLERRLGPKGTDQWIDLTVRRMASWGFNTVGNWSDVAARQRASRPVCGHNTRLGDRKRTNGCGRRLRRELRRNRGPRRGAAVRFVQERSVPAGLFRR